VNRFLGLIFGLISLLSLLYCVRELFHRNIEAGERLKQSIRTGLAIWISVVMATYCYEFLTRKPEGEINHLSIMLVQACYVMPLGIVAGIGLLISWAWADALGKIVAKHKKD